MSVKLDLVWTACFEDGRIIRQFDDEAQTVEHPFGEVQDHERRSPLHTFSLLNVNTRRVYQLNLHAGRIHIFQPGCTRHPEPEVEGDPSRRYRLIFFRRVRQRLSWAPSGPIESAEGVTTSYFLGFQYTGSDGRNITRLLQIEPDDEVYLS